MRDLEADSSKSDEQKEASMNLLPLALVFCLEASESVSHLIYNSRNIQELNRYSWNGTSATLVRIVGALFAGILMEKLSRIIAVRLSFLLLILGLLVLYSSGFENLICFSCGDLIIKFASGMEASSIVYIVDYNPPRRRTKLLLSVVPVTLLSYYMPHVARSYYHSMSECAEILFLIVISVAFLGLSHFYLEVPVRKSWSNESEPVVEDEKKSSDIEIDDCSTSTCDSDDDPKAKFPKWMDNTYPSFAISFFILFSVWPKVGLSMLVDRYKPKLMLEREEENIDRITSLVMLISSIIGFLFLNYCRRRTFLIIYSIILVASSISNTFLEYLFDGVMPEYELPVYSFVALISVWINLGLATIGSWMMMIVIMGELTPSRKRGFITCILWAAMVLQTFIVKNWLSWMDKSISLCKFHLIMVFVGFKIFMWARSHSIDGRDKTQEQIDVLWEEVIVRRRTRYKFYRKCLMCCLPNEKSVSRAETVGKT